MLVRHHIQHAGSPPSAAHMDTCIPTFVDTLVASVTRNQWTENMSPSTVSYDGGDNGLRQRHKSESIGFSMHDVGSRQRCGERRERESRILIVDVAFPGQRGRICSLARLMHRPVGGRVGTRKPLQESINRQVFSISKSCDSSPTITTAGKMSNSYLTYKRVLFSLGLFIFLLYSGVSGIIQLGVVNEKSTYYKYCTVDPPAACLLENPPKISTCRCPKWQEI